METSGGPTNTSGADGNPGSTTGPSKGRTSDRDIKARRPRRPRFTIKAHTREEAAQYDFVKARGLRKTTNLIESTAHLIKSCLGGGMVAIHEAYKQCGLFTALIMNIFLGLSVAYCMHILSKSAQKMYGKLHVPKMTFPDLAEASLAVGPWRRFRKHSRRFRYAVDGIITIDLFGSCCVYQVVIARTIKQLIEQTDTVLYEGIKDGYPSMRIYIICLMLPCILICMITTLKYLAPFSIIGDVFILLVAGATVYYGTKNATVSPTEFPYYKSIAGLLEFMGVCVFSVEGIGATLAIENNMTKPKHIWVVIYMGMSIVVGIVMIMGFFGYWGFGELSRSPITVNFPWEPFPIALKGMMALMIYVTFALNFWIPFELVWVYLRRRHEPQMFWFWERVYRAAFVVGITLIAFVFPNVSKFMGLLGSFCLSNMGYIFPALIELSLDWTDPGLGFMRWRLMRAILIMLFGLILCIVGTYSNFKEMIVEVFFS